MRQMTTEQYIEHLEQKAKSLDIKALAETDPEEVRRYRRKAGAIRSNIEQLKKSTGTQTADRKF